MGATQNQDKTRNLIQVYQRMMNSELKKAAKAETTTKGYVSIHFHRADLFREIIEVLKIIYQK